MRFKIIGLLAVVLLLAACETTPQETAATSAEGATTTSAPPPAAAGGPVTEEVVTAVTPPIPYPLPGTEDDLIVNVGDRVFFDFDKSDIRADAQVRLDAIANWLKRYPKVTVTIEGHTDPRGTREYNLALGDRRANAARDYVITLGIDPNRMKTISYGKERPAVVGSNEWAWQQDRRAVFVVDKGE